MLSEKLLNREAPMDKERFKAIDNLRPSESAVDSAVKAALEAEQSGKVLTMKRTKKRFNIKLASAMAACLVAAIACAAVFGGFGKGTSENSFFLVANASEATGDEVKKINNSDFTAVGQFKSTGGAMDLTENTANNVSEDFRMDLKCVGDNIDTVTYSFNNSKVFIADYLSDRLVSYTGKDDEFHNMNISYDGHPTHCYDSVTTKYDNQLSWGSKWEIMTYIENSPEYAEVIENYLKFDRTGLDIRDAVTCDLYKGYIEEYYKALLDNTSVKVTVTYRDGSSETKVVMLTRVVSSVGTRVSNEDTSEEYMAYTFEIGVSAKLV